MNGQNGPKKFFINRAIKTFWAGTFLVKICPEKDEENFFEENLTLSKAKKYIQMMNFFFDVYQLQVRNPF